MPACSNQVAVRRRQDRTVITVRCGKWYNGERVYCDACEGADDMSFPSLDDYHRVTGYDEVPLYPSFR